MDTCYNNSVYENIANEFDNTRFSRWKCVTEFLDSFPPNSYIFDCGTGNGKYVQYRKDIIFHGSDICSSLLEIANSRYKGVDFIRCDANYPLPYKDNVFDASISVAMLHHLGTYEKRLGCLKELLRITCVGGKVLVTVWAREQIIKQKWNPLNNNGDFLVPWHTRDKVFWRFYHLFDKNEIKRLGNDTGCSIEIHYELDNWILIIHKK